MPITTSSKENLRIKNPNIVFDIISYTSHGTEENY